MYQVDAFTSILFKGNPAAVILVDHWLDDQLMLNIAFENNLSETAFVKKIAQDVFEIRWFTSQIEVNFCGHATLASAFILFQQHPSLKEFTFKTRVVGNFQITQQEDGRIVMNFPIQWPTRLHDYPNELEVALGRSFKAVYLNEKAYIVEYDNSADIQQIQPHFELLKQIGLDAEKKYGTTRNVAITAMSHGQYNCISRYFAPVVGVNEDAVTGSIHAAIVPLLNNQSPQKLWVAYQASSRGGVMYCSILDTERIEVSGYAKLFMTANVYI